MGQHRQRGPNRQARNASGARSAGRRLERLLQRRDFKRDPDEPQKFERYQAEALVHKHCPVTGLLGVICHTEAMKQQIDQQLAAIGLPLPVYARTDWYFR